MFIRQDKGYQGHDAHWQAGGVDFPALCKELPDRLQQAFLAPINESMFGPPERDKSDLRTQGVVLIEGLFSDRLALVLAIKPEQNLLIGLYPWIERGTEVSAAITAVHEWEHGLQARVDATVRVGGFGLDVTFFDPLYANYRAWYSPKRRYRVALAGMAYGIGSAPEQTFDLDIARLRPGLARAGIDVLDQMPDKAPVTTRGMGLLLPLESGEADDWLFRGTIQRLQQQAFFGQPAWIAWVRVVPPAKGGDAAEVLDLPVLFVESVLGGDRLPEVGDDVHGSLWLQGWLWMPEWEQAG